MATVDRRSTTDDVGRSILYEGANQAQLCVLFKCDTRTIKERMHGLVPVGKRSGVDIFDVAEVAARMGKMTEEQVNKAIRRLNHADLPKALTKEYWAGQRSRQEYELRAGDLWPTSKVVEEVGEMVKSLKMELDLLTDAIERQTEMSDRQREVAKQLIKGAKENMLTRLKEKFQSPNPATEQQINVIPDDDDEL